MSAQYIYTTYKLSRRYPPDKQVLSDISLSFLPGAKIGVLGYNGAGKSTLLRIMAGIDTEYDGQAQLAPGATVGLLEQEPQLDPAKDVRGNVEEGVAEVRALLDRFNELSMNYSDETADEFAPGAGADRRGRRLEPRHHARDRDGRAALPAARCRRLDPLGRRAAPRCAVPAAPAPARPSAPRRADQPPRCRVGRVARAPPPRLQGNVVAVTHDRYFLDNVAGWILELDRGRGIPYQGNYSGWLEQKRARLEQEARQEAARKRTIEQELEWVRMNASARRNKPKARLNAYEALLAAGAQRQARPGPDPHPGRAAARARWWSRPRGCARPTAIGC